MQEHAREALVAGDRLVQCEIAVLGVADDGVAGVGQVHADLVRAAGLQRNVQQREAAMRLRRPDQRDRAPAVRVRGRDHLHVAFAGGVQRLVQRLVDDLQVLRPGAADECLVVLAGVAGAELVLQRHQRAALLGQQQHARGFLVEPVHELQEAGVGTRLAQLLDHARADAAAAMHGHAGRLVDGQQVLVLEQDGELARRHVHHRALGQAHRRHADLVARGHPGVGAGAALVDAHLAAADDAVDVGLGHALQDAQQEIVEALAVGFSVDGDALHLRRRGGDF